VEKVARKVVFLWKTKPEAENFCSAKESEKMKLWQFAKNQVFSGRH
jgi:hypothetical protein